MIGLEAGGNRVVTTDITLAKVCPFCHVTHWDIIPSVVMKKCACGAAYAAEWNQQSFKTEYVWVKETTA